ncbi:MAG: alanine--tRNA ligase [Rhodobacteraceae bacterium]|nr:alanine--tRNA ligase [Paracoccaceae bacterium]
MNDINQIRTAFLEYFGANDHEILQSSPLVPRNDATLLFTNSGMVQFKNWFTGIEQPRFPRATTSQKCLRAGGKHNDLENVGYTARHHTFFEMLGNFSFGDYFKERAISHCWELITKEFGVSKDRLWATTFHDDSESFRLWKRIAGLPDHRIVRISTSDNFWTMGATGPCGPCTELFFDYGEEIPGGPPGSADEDGDRFVEIWNLVFMQFEQLADGRRISLPKPSVDTGMGLERIGALLAGTNDNYETDLFRTLIEASAAATGTEPYGPQNVHHRVIADHLRSASFMIAEGVLPSKVGRGYVLRRIMRRAMRHANLLGSREPLLCQLVPVLLKLMEDAFPELRQAKASIADTLLHEERRFQQTLDRGLHLLDSEVRKLAADQPLPGHIAFKLYDTYGFPLDLTQDALRGEGRDVDVASFDDCMNEQRSRARAQWKGSGEATDDALWFQIAEDVGVTEFLGHASESAAGKIVAIVRNGKRVDTAVEGEVVEIVVGQTPFYAEAGGQVGDTGRLEGESGSAAVTDTQGHAGLHCHRARLDTGRLAVGDDVSLCVDVDRRTLIRRNHSATHLLNEALRLHLGDHVAQRGSLNADDRLRFDFSHTGSLSLGQLEAVETTINSYIAQDAPVETRLMTLDEARQIGAQALFGEKYDEEVRVVSMGRLDNSGRGVDGNVFSVELCGGTHVRNTGDIGLFVTLGETSVSAGVRRIEALTGEQARRYLVGQDHRCAEIALMLKSSAEDVVERVAALIADRNRLRQEVRTLQDRVATGGSGGAASALVEQRLSYGTYVGHILEGATAQASARQVDSEKKRIEEGVVVVVSSWKGKGAVTVGVTADLARRCSAVRILKDVVARLGGRGGGGRDDFARGGGREIAERLAEDRVGVAEVLENLGQEIGVDE